MERVALCPGCKTPAIKINRWAWFIGGLSTAGCLSFFVIGLFLLPLTPLLLFMPTMYKCKQCGHWWRENQIKEHMEM